MVPVGEMVRWEKADHPDSQEVYVEYLTNHEQLGVSWHRNYSTKNETRLFIDHHFDDFIMEEQDDTTEKEKRSASDRHLRGYLGADMDPNDPQDDLTLEIEWYQDEDEAGTLVATADRDDIDQEKWTCTEVILPIAGAMLQERPWEETGMPTWTWLERPLPILFLTRGIHRVIPQW
jgi:hypothetical protein